MLYSFRWLTARRRLPAVIFAVTALGIGACSSPGGTAMTPIASSRNAIPRPAASATATPLVWTHWLTVNDTSLSGTNNRITGIEDGSAIVGVNYGNSNSNLQSFVAATPSPAATATGYVNFNTISDPQASVTYFWGRANTGRGGEVGYIVPQGGSYTCNPCGITHGNSFKVINNPAAGSCNNSTLRGINSSWMTVGYYLYGSGCGSAASFEQYNESVCCASGGSTVTFAPFTPPGPYSSAVATGINGTGDVVGYSTTSGVSTGWFYSYFAYYPIRVPNATSTQALAVDWQDDVVGQYWDGSGGPYGFVMQHPSGVQAYQYPIYYEGNSNYSETIPYSISDCGNIAGTYLDSSTGFFNGFVAARASKGCGIK